MNWLLRLLEFFLVGLGGLFHRNFELLPQNSTDSIHDVHHYTLVLEEANFTRLCSTKSMLTANGTFPGPTLHVHKGDRAFVNVLNNGNYGVTIHWHGVRQMRNPWSDGPENITQCPIQPGNNFTYEIIFTEEEGTLWWHAHSEFSRATVHGALIIYPAIGTTYPFLEPYAEEIVFLASWFSGDVMEIYEEAAATGADPAVSDALTINGQPGDLYNCSSDSTYRFYVDANETYLLRLINGVMNEEMFFYIADHNLTIVGHDGAYIKPIVTDYLMITPGQTMDILITTNQTPSYYYIAANPYEDSNAPFDNTTTTAILEYNGNYTTPSSPVLPTLLNNYDTTSALNFTSRLRSLASPEHPIYVPVNITDRMYVTVSVNQLICPNASCGGPNGNRLAASFNNVSFVSPSIDVLQAYFRNLSDVYESDFPNFPLYFFNFTGDVGNDTVYTSQGTKASIFDYGAEVEIVLQGTNIGNAENHPIHLHGYSFYVIGMGDGNFNETSDPETYNLIDPPYVNTVGVPKNGWATIRFVADNPGVWFVHCHLERHLSWGLDTILIVKNGDTEETSMRPPPPNMPTCT